MAQKTLEPRVLHDLGETAWLLCVSVRQVQKLIAAGELTRVKIGSKPLVARAEVETYVKRLTLLAENGA